MACVAVSMGLAVAMNKPELLIGVPVGLGAMVFGIGVGRKNLRDYEIARESIPEKVKNTKKAFWELHKIAVNADSLMEEYVQHFS